MNKARDEYYKYYDAGEPIVGDYISELEAENKNLTSANKESWIIIQRLEAERVELIEFMLKVESHFGPYAQGACREELWGLCKELKQKYGEEMK